MSAPQTVKAYMSEPGEGPVYYDGNLVCYADGRTFASGQTLTARDVELAQYAAEREAARILADVEPAVAIEGIGDVHPYWGHAGSRALLSAMFGERTVPLTIKGARRQERRALAAHRAVLASFVGDEDGGARC